jgi:hypothetical protein
LVLNSVCLTMNHAIVTEYCVTGEFSPQFLPTELPLTNQLPPQIRVLRNLTSPQTVKFPALYEIWKFIITFTTARQLCLFRTRSIQSKPSFHFLNNHFNINLPSTCVPSGLFTSGFTRKFCMHRSSPSACYMSHLFHNYSITPLMFGGEY